MYASEMAIYLTPLYTSSASSEPCGRISHNFDGVVCDGVVVSKIADRTEIVIVSKAEDAERIRTCGGNRAKVGICRAQADCSIGSRIATEIDVEADVCLHYRAGIARTRLYREYCLRIGNNRGKHATGKCGGRSQPCHGAYFGFLDGIVILYPVNNTEERGVAGERTINKTRIKQLYNIALAERIGIGGCNFC